MFLSISATHIIISAIVLLFIFFCTIYVFYRLVKNTVKKWAKEAEEKQ
jgi:archaellum component FlaF (FlaF/FlaG flagellin family)